MTSESRTSKSYSLLLILSCYIHPYISEAPKKSDFPEVAVLERPLGEVTKRQKFSIAVLAFAFSQLRCKI